MRRITLGSMALALASAMVFGQASRSATTRPAVLPKSAKDPKYGYEIRFPEVFPKSGNSLRSARRER
jgi:hypothetical protein